MSVARALVRAPMCQLPGRFCGFFPPTFQLLTVGALSLKFFRIFCRPITPTSLDSGFGLSDSRRFVQIRGQTLTILFGLPFNNKLNWICEPDELIAVVPYFEAYITILRGVDFVIPSVFFFVNQKFLGDLRVSDDA